jgi:heptosyltransferase-2
MVMAQSLFKTLKQTQPECQIDVLAPAWTFALLARMPEVENALEMPLGHGKLGLKQRIDLGRSLRDHQYHQAILLPNSWKSALTPFFANIPIRTGYIGECRWGLLNDTRRLDKMLLTMTVQRFVALAHQPDACQAPEYPVPQLSIDKSDRKRVVAKFKINTDKKILGLCPGAEYGPAKRWPTTAYAQLAQHYLKQDWQVWLFGSEKDRPVTDAINKITGQHCQDFSGRTALAEALDLMSLVDRVVSNDSGLMHVAAALNKPLVAVYGSSDPGFTPPLHAQAKVISLSLECSPCFKRDCPLGHTNCLNNISPEQVIGELAKL